MKRTRHRQSSGLCHKNGKSVRFYFDHKPYYGIAGDTVESALLANDIFCFGYSGTYHLPSGTNSNNIYKGIVEIEKKNKEIFSAPAADISLSENMNIFSTNSKNIFSGLKSLSLKNFFSDTVNGYTKHYSEDRQSFLNYSVGKSLSPLLEASTEKKLHHPDIHIIGGGISGLYAALICVMSGLRVLITEQKPEIYFPKTQSDIFSRMSQALLETVSQHPLITILNDTTILPIDKSKDYVTGIEAQKSFDPEQSHSYHTNIHIIKAKHSFIATGIKELGFICSGFHMGGIFTPESYNDQHHLFGVDVEKNIVLYVNNDKAYDILNSANLSPEKINGIIDQRHKITETMQNAIDQGYSVYSNALVTQLQGKERPEIITFQTKDHDKLNSNPKNIECEILIQSSGHQLDLNIYRNALDTTNIVTDNKAYTALIPSSKSLHDSFSVIGYGTGKTNYSDLLKETYILVKNCLEENGITVEFPETTSEHLSKEIHLAPAEFIYAADKKLIDKTYFPFDVRFADLRDAILKDQPIEDILTYFSDTDILNQDQNTIFRIISEVAHEYKFTEEKKYALFFKTYQNIYSKSKAAEFASYVNNISLIGHIYPALYSAYRKFDIPISTEKREIGPQTLGSKGDKNALTQLYSEIKSNYAVRDLSFLAGPFILMGPDSALLLEKTFNISILDLAVGKSRDVKIKKDDKIDITLIIAHNQKDNFFITSTDCAHATLKTLLEDKLCSNKDLKFSLGDQSEQMSMLQILGKEANHALSFLNISLGEASAKDNDFLNLWYKNIEIHLLHKTEYDLPSLTLFIPSDATADIFPHFFSDSDNIKNQIFDETMIHILSFENGVFINNAPQNLLKKYPYRMCALPLSEQDVIKEDMAIFENKTDKNPIGLITQTCYSPLLKKYIASALLSVKPEHIENKTIFAYHKQDDLECHVKILSAENIMQKEPVYE